MRRRFPEVRADRAFSKRVDELREEFSDEDRLAMILADANLVWQQIEQVLGEAGAAETKTREGVRKTRPPRQR